MSSSHTSEGERRPASSSQSHWGHAGPRTPTSAALSPPHGSAARSRLPPATWATPPPLDPTPTPPPPRFTCFPAPRHVVRDVTARGVSAPPTKPALLIDAVSR
ncbi:mucin-7-like [Schistocerca gregaria]|uniref:mucin-7-like n=1 Tax=Schistocerca gregaria TaxID=7010 RepID=UPI00211EC466|nr:mucin-7-like [Schistocerca gregaria]